MPIKPTLLFFLVSYLCFSQDIKVSGTVKTGGNAPLAYANIILTNLEAGATVSGTTSLENGSFNLDHLSPGIFQLHVSFIGFTTYVEELKLEADLVLEDIVLQEVSEALETVEITSRKPTFKKQSDRLIFNIENTSLTEGSIYDVLKSTPGILIMNDEISVKNSTNIIYLINGKRVYLSGEELQQLLSGTAANFVQEVEVITNPSAKYDAEGAAVINIKMSKNLITGYNGSVYGNFTQGIYPRYNAGMSHFYKTDKLNVFANYSYGESKINRLVSGDIKFIENNSVVGNWQSDIDRNTTSKSHNANMNLDYALNDLNTILVSANANITPYWKRKSDMFTEAVDSSFTAVNNTDDTTTNVAVNLDYIHTAKSGNSFSVNLHHTNYDYDRYQDITSTYFDADKMFTREHIFNSDAFQKTYIYSGQADYKINFDTGFALETGVKVSYINSDSDVKQMLYGTVVLMDPLNSGRFDYDEMNYAGYVNASKALENWQFSVGLRGEYTNAEGVTSSTNTTNTFDYFKLFPNLNISHDFNENHSLGLSYGKRIERPTYAALNPFKYYFNDYTYLQGNPNLKPTLSHVTTLSYTLKQTYTFEVYYRYEDSPETELVFQENDSNLLIYAPVNLVKSVDYGFDFMTYKPISQVWAIYVINSIFHDTAYFKALQSGNVTQTNDTWAMYTNFMNFFTFLKDGSLSAELSLLYMSPMINGSADISSRTQLDFGMKKSFNNGKWVVSLKASDIFRTTDFTEKNRYLNQNNSYYSRFDNQWIRVGLRYNFGNTKLTTNEREDKELNERNRLQSEEANH